MKKVQPGDKITARWANELAEFASAQMPFHDKPARDRGYIIFSPSVACNPYDITRVKNDGHLSFAGTPVLKTEQVTSFKPTLHVIVNSSAPISVNGKGWGLKCGYTKPYLCRADNTATWAVGDSVGLKPNDKVLSKDYFGFRVARIETSVLAWCFYDHFDRIWEAEAIDSISASNTATIELYHDGTTTSIQVEAKAPSWLGDAIGVGDMVFAQFDFHEDRWKIVGRECSA